jgi:hypothetical protein
MREESMREKFYRRDGTVCRGGLLEWAKLMEDPHYKIVSQTELEDGTVISTVWLGVDHNFGGKGPPIIFETMVFAPKQKDECFREDMDCER